MEGDLPMACFNQKVGEQLERLCAEHRIKLLWQEPMSAHTTFRAGGPARYFVTPEGEKELAAVLAACRSDGSSCRPQPTGCIAAIFTGVRCPILDYRQRLEYAGQRPRA